MRETSLNRKNILAARITSDKYAPEGITGSLTAILQNITTGVKNGKSDAQKAAGVSGFLATDIIIKNPIIFNKMIGSRNCCPSSSVFTIAPTPAKSMAKIA